MLCTRIFCFSLTAEDFGYVSIPKKNVRQTQNQAFPGIFSSVEEAVSQVEENTSAPRGTQILWKTTLGEDL